MGDYSPEPRSAPWEGADPNDLTNPIYLHPIGPGDLAECSRCGAAVPTSTTWGTSRHTQWHDALDTGQQAAAQLTPGALSLVDELVRARKAFERATPPATPAAVLRLLRTISDLGAPHGTHVDSATKWVEQLARRARQNQEELDDTRKITAELIARGAPDGTYHDILTWVRDRLGPYTWQPGDPPPPAHVMVLHNPEDQQLAYLCRVGYGGTDWGYSDEPNHAYSGPARAWEAIAEEQDGPLIHIPGGDV